MSDARPVLLIDFDSTFTQVEALELLAESVFEGDSDAEAKRAEIAELTQKAMSGEIGFGEALSRRIALLAPSQAQIDALVERLKTLITPSVERNRAFFERRADRVYIVSGGFHEMIDPVVEAFGVTPDHVLANRLVWNAEGRASGVDVSNPLSRDGGKIEAVKALNLSRSAVAVGDGWTDYELKAGGVAERFYAFVENVSREPVVARADQVVRAFDEVLHAEGYHGRFSFPRSRLKVLLLENIHPDAVARFREEGYEVETVKGALDEPELIERIKDVAVLGIRSKTQLTRAALEAAERLLAVGAFCIGTNQIDLAAASERGVAVFNAPYSNTRSVVEMVMGLIVALERKLFDKSVNMHAGKWDKSATGSREVRGKTLGLIGYGAIGSQLSVLAESFGMRVIYYDLAEKLSLGNARRVRRFDDLLAEADVISVHVDGRVSNTHIIGASAFAAMKDGALFINLARGHVVDVEALAAAVKSGKIAGAAIDVFPEEPRTNDDPFESPLQGLANVVLSPHIGGSTEEAQEAIAEFASERLLGFVNRGDTTFSVNMPAVQLTDVEGSHRLLHIHKNQPGMLAAINKVLADFNLNVVAQHLKTNERIGYVIIDVDLGYPKEAHEALRTIPGTLKFRPLY